METRSIHAFEEYLKRKELELSLINSQINIDSSGSYSSSPLINFAKRIKEFDVVVKEESSTTKFFRNKKKTVYMMLIVILAIISILCLI